MKSFVLKQDKHMKIVYLIGNGFDINIGLKTKYKDFYDYYLNLDRSADNEQVAKLKQALNPKDQFWSDLEIALGEYTTNFSSLEEMEFAYNDLNDKFRDFIGDVEKTKLVPAHYNTEKLIKGLAHPENALCRADKESLLNFYKNWQHDSCEVRIITFNYTSTIEQLTGYNIRNGVKLSKWPLNELYNVHLVSITHIHGKSDIPILGLSNKEQIKNQTLRDNIEIQEYLLKPLLNKMQGHLLDRDTARYISWADVICVYGLSLGETDSNWWNLIAHTLLTKHTRLVFFAYEDNYDPRPQCINRMKRCCQNKFLNTTTLTDEEKKKIRDKIYVVNRSPIFDIRK